MLGNTITQESPALFERNESFACDFLAHLQHFFQGARSAAGGPSHGLQVLDVGTGTARIPIEICSRRDDIRFVAIDRSARTLHAARKNVDQAGLSRTICIVRAEANSLPFANGSFDAVISNSLLHHVADRLALLREMTRVVRTGGLHFIRDTIKGSDAELIARVLSEARQTRASQRAVCETGGRAMLTVEEARGLAQAAGFPHECVEPSGPRHWILAHRLPPVPVDLTARLRY